MKKIITSLLIASVIFTGCLIKKARIMKSGEVEQEEFKVEIPFEYRLELIILKVKIDGTEYDFLLDTGAPNVLSKELTRKLHLNSKVSQKVTDSQGENSDLDLVIIDKINIGGINFLNTGAVVVDLNISNEIACLKIDGIIGTNLMKKAIWEIDCQNQKITITNSLSSLEIPPDSKKIPFSQNLQGTPIIDINLNGQIEKSVIVDLGSNGDINVSGRKFNKLLKSNALTSTTFGYGISSSGLYGAGKTDTINYAIVPNISFGDITLKNQIVSFKKKKSSKTVGTNFFKNYRMIFSWFDKEIIMIKTNEYDNTKLNNYGFVPTFKGNKIFIGLLYNLSSAENAGLKLGDQILEIKGKDYNNVLPDHWCEIMDAGLTPDNNPISITVLREGEKLIFELVKTTLLE